MQPPLAARQIVPEPTVPLSAEYVLATLARLMPHDAVVVEEAPSHRPAVHAYLPIRTSGGFYAGASGGLGFALPAAIGVALANPARRVIALVGDGSIQYTIQALWTAAQHRVPLTIVVLNNGGYGALKSFGEILGTGPTLDFDLPGLDLVAIARGYGCVADRIEQPSELADALQRALSNDRPTVLDVIVDPKVATLY